ncbi:MAG: hypothetical protein WA783_11740 [Phormidesmis sp.]
MQHPNIPCSLDMGMFVAFGDGDGKASPSEMAHCKRSHFKKEKLRTVQLTARTLTTSYRRAH